MTLDSQPDPSAPLVSVAMTAYRSAQWLPRAVESVFQQQTAFALELVLGDDCSTDGTAEVLRTLQAQHGPRLRVLPRAERLGMQRNYFDTFEHCRGRYIAWLDSDDSWTEPHKLQRQVDALEQDASLSACGHFVRQVNPAGEIVTARRPAMPPGRYGLAAILAENFIPSPSIVFRNGVQRELPESFFHLSGVVDWPILLMAARHGDILLMDGVMADYVLHPGSAYQGKGPIYQDTLDLEFYAWAASLLPPQWQRRVRAARGIRHDAISYHLLQQGRTSEARAAALRALRVPHPLDNLTTKWQPLALVAAAPVLRRLRR